MIEILKFALNQFNTQKLENLEIIPWSSPIISFGNIETSQIATLGINPSDREFIDVNGVELRNSERRFHTLNSLGIQNWTEADLNQLKQIDICTKDYFLRNPYDSWFKRLDYIIAGSSKSYYFPSHEACHLDLIPWATRVKWSNLKTKQQEKLLELSANILGSILKDSKIQVLVLNGQTVVSNLEKISSTGLKKKEILDWKLKRKTSADVKGYSYKGYIEKIGEIYLDEKILVLGYNHNIQSSFGVTSEVQSSIRKWISEQLNQVF